MPWFLIIAACAVVAHILTDSKTAEKGEPNADVSETGTFDRGGDGGREPHSADQVAGRVNVAENVLQKTAVNPTVANPPEN